MLAGLGVSESFGETEIDDVYVVLLFTDTNQEVIWLDIPVKEVARVHEFDPLQLITDHHEVKISYHLIRKHEDCLERELALTVVEEIFERGAQ